MTLAKQKLQALLEKRKSEANQAIKPQISENVETGTGVELSFGQQRFWFLNQYMGPSPVYNLSVGYILPADIDEAVLLEALNQLIERQQVLRSRFTANDNHAQMLLDSSFAEITVEQVADGAKVDEIYTQERDYPFDLSCDFLARIKLIKQLDNGQYNLFVTLHHSISDGWSIAVFQRELAALYGACQSREASTLAPLPIQYCDYSHWQNKRLSGALLDKQLDFWRGHLASAPALLNLPSDRARPKQQSFNGKTRFITLPAQLSDAVNALSKACGVTLYVNLMSAFTLLLSRYSGQSDIVLGTPVANRERPETQNLMGYFANTLVLRSQLDNNPKYADWLKQNQHMVQQSFSHQELPFEKLVEQLNPERSLSHSPIFQVMFALQNMPQSEQDNTSALQMKPYQQLDDRQDDKVYARFDLTFNMKQTAQGIAGGLEYNTDLFDQDTIDTLLRHYQKILETVVVNSTIRLNDIGLLDDSEIQQLLTKNACEHAFDRELTLHRMIEAQAECTPNAVAVSCVGNPLTYEQLNQKANQLADILRDKGVSADKPVGVCVERSTDMMVALLGVLKAGGCYVPLDPNYPSQRLGYVIDNSRIELLVSHRAVDASLLQAIAPQSDNNQGIETVFVDELDGAEARNSVQDSVHPDNLAYLIYTSGSTGSPKGVRVSHKNAVNFLTSMANKPGISADDKLLAVTTLSFDIALLELMLPLTVGACVEIAPYETTLDAGQLSALIDAQAITMMQATPITWQAMLENGWQGNDKLKALVGGEAVPLELVARLTDKVNALWNMYGPTETTVWSAINLLSDQSLEGDGYAAIGSAVGNTEIVVLDGNLGLCPVGAVGELYIGGEGLSQGYYGKGGLTAERFIPNPFGKSGERLYRTGDLGRLHKDGTLACLGRIDHQVKVRGFRIELGEIESALLKLPEVSQAVVVAVDGTQDKRLVAYVVAAPGQAQLSDKLRTALQQNLPGYMVPSAFVFLDCLPLTNNGKVARDKLPAPESIDGRPEYVAPSGEVETKLAAIWCEILKIERAGRLDNFFELGGHSLLVTQLLARIFDGFGVALSIRRLFELQRLSEQAAAIAESEASDSNQIPLASRQAPLLLSFAQQRLWFLNQYMGPNAVFNIPLALRLHGDVDCEALSCALQQIFARHEVLRTRFAEHPELKNEAVQIISQSDLELEIETVACKQQLTELCLAERNYPFDLAKDDLCRVRLIKDTSSGQSSSYLLLVTMHHSVTDIWSMGIFFRELVSLYKAFTQGEPSPLEDLPLQYADYAQWLRQRLQGQGYQEQLNYWRKQLADMPPLLTLPTDRPRPQEQTFNGANEPIAINKALADKLEQLCQDRGVTLYMSLLSAFAVLLGRFAGQDDVAIGTPIANRVNQQTEGLIGFFLNSLVMRNDLTGDPSFTTLLERNRQMSLDAYGHQDIPFEQLVEELNPERSTSHSPLFQVSFSLLNTPMDPVDLDGLKMSPEPLDTSEGVARYDITFNVSSSDKGILGGMEYNTDLFDRSTIKRMLSAFERLVDFVVTEPDTPLSQFNLLSREDKLQQLDWNNNALDYPKAMGVHQLVEQQAERNPDAIAITFDDEQVSYLSLNQQANQLAHYLRSKGIGLESRVGICVERSVNMVVGILAILKSGGCYVPLDPGYPQSRLEYMHQQSDCAFVLTERHLLEDMEFLSGVKTFPLDPEVRQSMLANFPLDNPNQQEVGLSSANLAYITFTSGTTGEPKGVAISHQNITSLVSCQSQIALDKSDVVAQMSNYSFDAITYEMWAALANGGRMVIIDKDTLLQPTVLHQVVLSEGITTIFVTTALFNRICQQVPDCFATVRKVLFGGEAYSAREIETALANGPDHLFHVYGPTESTTYATGFELTQAQFGQTGIAPIGRALPNNTCFVIQDGELVPPGVVGELYIGGDGLSRGYQGRAKLTAEKFVPNPFSPEPGERLYRTGDLVRLLPDGEIEFVGRIDSQVKIRGFRIELAEIESVLRKHSEVKEVVLQARLDSFEQKQLVAYVVTTVDEYDEDAVHAMQLSLLEYLQGQLPDYMVPSAFMLIPQLPLTGNKKIDYSALPAPDESAYARTRYVSPKTEMEKRLVALWQDNLNLNRVGIEDNYFTIGGDSIRSISLVAEAEKQQLIFSVKDLFTHSTVAGLAQVVKQQSTEHVHGSSVAAFEMVNDEVQSQIRQRFVGKTVKDIYPMSMAQQGMIFHTLQQPDMSIYHVQHNYRFNLLWDESVFADALNHLSNKHEIFRTVFVLEDAHQLQVVLGNEQAQFEVVDIRHLDRAAQKQTLDDWVASEKRTPIDMQSFLWRITVHLLADDEVLFGMTFHHAIWDGWSNATFVNEFLRTYEALRKGLVIAADSEPPLPFNRFIALEQAAINSQDNIDYWQQKLSNASLPWWSGEKQAKSIPFYCDIPQHAAREIVAIGRNAGVQEKSVWSAVYLMLLSLLDGNNDVIGSVVTHGRPELPGGDKTLGVFLNLLPLRIDISEMNWLQLIEGVEQELQGLHQVRHYPLVNVQAQSGLNFAASMFNFTNFHVYRKAGADKQILSGGGFEETNYRFAVEVSKNEQDQSYAFYISVDPTVFDEDFRNRIAGYVVNIVEQMVAASHKPIDKSTLLGAAEQQQLRQTRQQSEQSKTFEFADNAAIADLFERQTAMTPDAIAVKYQQQQLSYAELNQKANQLAHALLQRGVGPEVKVGICVERSTEMVMAIVAVLKAGGAYVPLDPNYPEQRLEYMIEHSGCALVLTEQYLLEDLAVLQSIKTLPVDQEMFDMLLCRLPIDNPNRADANAADPLAYVIYTSGSTGQPKGVEVCQSGVVNYLEHAANHYFKDCHGAVVSTSLNFDATVTSMLTPLVCGKYVHLLPSTVNDIEALHTLLSDVPEACVFKLTPAHLEAMKELRQAGSEISIAHKLVIGGEQLTTGLLAKWRQWLPNASFVNEYGPTETVVGCSTFTVTPTASLESSANGVAIGDAIVGNELYVVDQQLNLLPHGVPGELLIGGAQVARGYLNDEVLTEQKFIDNPFGAGRLYRSGDLVRKRGDGNLEFVGRVDSQVKIRGFRIELGEIEAVLKRHPQVKELVVALREDEPDNKILVAYVVWQNTQGEHIGWVNQLRQLAQQQLPNYMVISAIVELDDLPLTVNGKVDRSALPAPDLSASQVGFVAPRNELERQLCIYWQQLLNVEQVGIVDNFWALGGQSLLALRLSNLLRDELQVDVSLHKMFEYQNIEGLAGYITEQQELAKINEAKRLVLESEEEIDEGSF